MSSGATTMGVKHLAISEQIGYAIRCGPGAHPAGTGVVWECPTRLVSEGSLRAALGRLSERQGLLGVASGPGPGPWPQAVFRGFALLKR